MAHLLKAQQTSSAELGTAGLVSVMPRAARTRDLWRWGRSRVPSTSVGLGLFFLQRVSQKTLCTVSKLCANTLSPYPEH